jgi:hypothetical protein
MRSGGRAKSLLTRVVLRNQRDDRGTRHLSAGRDPDGRIRIACTRP